MAFRVEIALGLLKSILSGSLLLTKIKKFNNSRGLGKF